VAGWPTTGGHAHWLFRCSERLTGSFCAGDPPHCPCHDPRRVHDMRTCKGICGRPSSRPSCRTGPPISTPPPPCATTVSRSALLAALPTHPSFIVGTHARTHPWGVLRTIRPFPLLTYINCEPKYLWHSPVPLPRLVTIPKASLHPHFGCDGILYPPYPRYAVRSRALTHRSAQLGSANCSNPTVTLHCAAATQGAKSRTLATGPGRPLPATGGVLRESRAVSFA